MYDPEAIYQDADIEMWEMQARARDLAAAEKAGRCTHQSTVGVSASGKIFYPEQEGLTGTQVRCGDCQRVFADDLAWAYAIEDAIYG